MSSEKERVLSLLFGLVLIGSAVSGTVHAASQLEDWRSELVRVRALAENDTLLATVEVQRLQANQPEGATPVDKARILNLQSRIEVYAGLTEQSEQHARSAVEIAEKAGDKIGQVEAQLNFILIALNQGRINKLTAATTRSLKLLNGLDRPDLLSEAMLRLSNVYYRKGDLNNSVTTAMQAMEIAKRSNNPFALAFAHQGLAVSFSRSGRSTEAKAHYQQMREQARAAKSKLLEAYAVQGMAVADSELGDVKQGERLMKESILMFRSLHTPLSLNVGLFGLADLYRKQGEFEEAMLPLDEIVATCKRYSSPMDLWRVRNTRSEIFLAMGRIDEARTEAEQGYVTAQGIGLSKYQSESMQRLAAVAAAAGNYSHAYQLSDTAGKMLAKTAQNEAGSRMVQLTQRYETDSRQRQFAELNDRNMHQELALQTEKLHQRWLWTVVLGSIVALIATGYFLLRQRYANLKLAKINAQLRQSQNDLQATLDAIPDLMFDVTLEGRFCDFHTHRLESLAVPPEQFLGKTINEVMPPEVADVCMSALIEANATGISMGMQFSWTLQTGKQWFELAVARKAKEGDTEQRFIVLSRNITDRKNAQQLLQNSERKYRTLVEHHPDAIIRLDTRGRHTFINDLALKTLGVTREATLNKTVCELDIPGNPATLKPLLDSALKVVKTAQPDILELNFPNGDTFEVRHIPELDEKGEVVSILVIARDLTERKKTEEALLAREREFRSLAAHIPDNIARYDLQCRTQYINPTLEATLGQKLHELHGKTPLEFCCAPVYQEYQAKISAVIASGKEAEIEISVQGLGHAVRYDYIRFIPEFDDQGQISAVLAIGRDITEQKLAKDALHEREQRYREIFDNSAEGLYLLEVMEDGRFRNLDINPALVRMTGINREEAVGKYVGDISRGEAAAMIKNTFQRCVSTGKSIEGTVKIDLPVGNRYFNSTVAPIILEGRVQRLICIVHDITALKLTEISLEESQTMLRRLAAHREEVREEERKYIAREVHDELGQLLTGLKLNISILKRKFGADSEQMVVYLEETKALADKALKVARNVASALRPAALEMGIVSALEWLVGRFSSNTGIECIVDAEIDDNLGINEQQSIALFRIVQESLTNVARHAGACEVTVSLYEEADEYVLKVSDNGVGFDTRSKKMDSYGLVGNRERALILGGSVVINSQPGRGTEITVRIPSKKEMKKP